MMASGRDGMKSDEHRLAHRARAGSRRRTGLLILAASVVTAVAAACANVTTPEGGPEDRDPPVVVRTMPATGTVGVKPKELVIQFDEVISETPRGTPELNGLVFISPNAGRADVSWGRNRMSIRPRRGWKPNTVYSVTVSPGIVDLRANALDSTIRVVFSTGGEIPTTSITGVVFDWIAGRGMSKALVEAIAADSTTYQVLADSVGRYDLRYMPPGPYRIRAFADRNSNRELDPLEAWDTTSLTITTTATADLYAFPHDTVGLRIADMTLLDSGRTVKLTFDKPYVSEQNFTLQTVTVKASDSSTVRVSKVESAPQRALFDSLARKAKADSAAAKLKAKEDTSPAALARLDSLNRRRRLDSLAVVERLDREARRLAQLRGNRPPPPRDTTPPPKMRRDNVYRELYVSMVEPLAPGAQFRLQVLNIRSLSGTIRSPARTLSTPKPDKKADNTKVDSISTAAPPVKKR